MPLYSNFQNLKFLIDSGISAFIQDTPNPIYHSKRDSLENKSNIKNISEVQTLSELELFIKNSNTCSLKKNANNTVFADGNPLSKIMLIGEVKMMFYKDFLIHQKNSI